MKIRAAALMIHRMYMLALVLVAVTLSPVVGNAQDAIDAPVIYRLNAESSFQRGCFAPCLCPVRQVTDAAER